MSDDHYGPDPQPEPEEEPQAEEQAEPDPTLQHLDGRPFYVPSGEPLDYATFRRVRDSLLEGRMVLGEKLPDFRTVAETCPNGCHLAIWLHDEANDEWYLIQALPMLVAHMQGMHPERLADDEYLAQMTKLNEPHIRAVLN